MSSRHRIDKFFVPAAAYEAFLHRIRRIDTLLSEQDGCDAHGIYECALDGGDYTVVTCVHWRNEDAMAAARQRVADIYRSEGFDPKRFMDSLGVTADMGVYSAVRSD